LEWAVAVGVRASAVILDTLGDDTADPFGPFDPLEEPPSPGATTAGDDAPPHEEEEEERVRATCDGVPWGVIDAQ
jgi:hypothetical protein